MSDRRGVEDDPVLAVRAGPGGTCSAAGSAIDMLFYGSLAASTLLVALRALVPPEDPPADPDGSRSDALLEGGPAPTARGEVSRETSGNAEPPREPFEGGPGH